MTALRAAALVLLLLGVVAGAGAGAAVAESLAGAERVAAAEHAHEVVRAHGGATLPTLVPGTELLVTDARGASLVGYGVVEVMGLTLQLTMTEGAVQVVVVLPGQAPLHVRGELAGDRVYLIQGDGVRSDLAEALARDERSLTLTLPDGRTVQVAAPAAPGAAPARDGPAVDAPVAPPGDTGAPAILPAVPWAVPPSVPAATDEVDPADEQSVSAPVGPPVDGPGPPATPATPATPDGAQGDQADPGEDDGGDDENGAGGRRPSGRP